MGRLDHVHIRVPDRAEAARWYAEHLGFEPVERFDFWATGFEGGPLQISADGGNTTLALFEASDAHPMEPQTTVASPSASTPTTSWRSPRSLPCGIDTPSGERARDRAISSTSTCAGRSISSTRGATSTSSTATTTHRVRDELVDADGVEVVRFWPRELYAAYRDAERSERRVR